MKKARKASRSAGPKAPSRKLPEPVLPARRYLFYGGKGGVGKTTAAAAAGLLLLERARGAEQILLFSTDPAHSLADSLEVEIGDRLVQVAARGKARLFARELDAGRALEEFKSQHRPVLTEIAERGTLLDESDINELLNLSMPGLDEVMALFELGELDRTQDFSRIVVDTAPSGHTARLLRLPGVFTHWVRALNSLAEKHRYMVAHFARRNIEDEVDRFLRDLAERIERVSHMLYNADSTAFTLVTIPEAMVVEETVRYYQMLVKEGVPVPQVLINRVEERHGNCRYCRARVTMQEPWLERIQREFSSLRIARVPLQSGEVRGIQSLVDFGKLAWGPAPPHGRSAVLGSKPGARKEATRAADAAISRPERGFEIETRQLLIFGGKGGVGKTTAAAAAALALAEGDPKARVLVFSTDPAHSLSDAFAEQVGELKRGLAGNPNLDGIEIDPAVRFQEFTRRYREWTDEVFDSLTGGSTWRVQFDREATRELVTLAPPGIDEIVALATISGVIARREYRTVVLDTAPTGHLIRFLETPALALSWLRALLRLLLKYKSIVRLVSLAEELVTLTREIRQVAALLTSKDRCEFLSVAIPERMSLEETARLTAALKRLKVPVRSLLINNVVPAEAAGRCAFCGARHRAQQAVIAEFAQVFKRFELFIAPQQPREVRGPELLRRHFDSWSRLSQQS